MTAGQLSLIAVPAARATDPATSHAAAETVAPSASRLEALIVATIAEHGPLTDDELCDRLPEVYGPTVRTARSRVAKRGEVVAAGEGRSARGCRMTMWVAS